MRDFKPIFLALALTTAAVTSLGAASPATAQSAEDLNQQSRQALESLERTNPAAAALASQARAVLIFPRIVKAGFVFGGAYGEGALMQGSNVRGYYNSVEGSWGLQAGAESYGYVVFLMTRKAERYIQETHGLELGVGPTLVVVNKGVEDNLSTSTLKDDAYAFVFDQQGLMADVSIEGTKISEIHPKL